MLPLYAAPEKMNRHGYRGNVDSKSPTSPVPFGYGGRAYTMGESGRGFKIKTDKWEKYVCTSLPSSWRNRENAADNDISMIDTNPDPREQHSTPAEAPSPAPADFSQGFC